MQQKKSLHDQNLISLSKSQLNQNYNLKQNEQINQKKKESFSFLRLPKFIDQKEIIKLQLSNQKIINKFIELYPQNQQVNKNNQKNNNQANLVQGNVSEGNIVQGNVGEGNVSTSQIIHQSAISLQKKKKKIITRKYFTQSDLDKIAKDFKRMLELQEKPEMEKDKIITLSQIARNHGFSYSSMSRLIAEYLEDENFTQRRQNIIKRKEKEIDEITKQRMEILGQILRENPHYVQREIARKMNQYQNLKRKMSDGKRLIHAPCISRLLRIGGYRKKMVQKIPIHRNTKENIERRFEYCTRFTQLTKENRKIYFLDESGFSVSSTRMKAWSRANEQVRIKCQLSKNQIVSLLAVIGVDGLAYYDVKAGNYDRVTYLRLMNQIFENVRSLNGGNDKSVLVMDNCTIHDKAQTNKMAEEKSIQIMFLPPYSPQLNPIQCWFHQIKSKLRQKLYKNASQLLIQMKIILQRYNDYSFKKYYGSINDSLSKGLRKIPL